MRTQLTTALIVLASIIVPLAAALVDDESAAAQDPPTSVSLPQGTSLIGYLGPTLPVEEALTNIGDAVTRIWEFDRFAPASGVSPWKVWSPELPDIVPGFRDLVFGRAYFVTTARAIDWQFAEGERPREPAAVELVAGGNAVVNFAPTQPVDEALGPVASGLRAAQVDPALVSVVWSLRGGTWINYAAALPAGLQRLKELARHDAYFVVVSQRATWSFDAGVAATGCTRCLETPPTGARDYGDAPDSYGTTLASARAASHLVAPGFFLGHAVDVEDDGQPSARASGDDFGDGRAFFANARVEGIADDEDGVIFLDPLVPGRSAQIVVLAQAVAFTDSGSLHYLNAWIDVDQNGSFDAGEQIVRNVDLAAGPNILTVDVPAGDPDQRAFFLRFRLSRTVDPGATGPGGEGEVEDYFVDGATFDVGRTDWGDAPRRREENGQYHYPTLAQDNGARHRIVPGFHLGDRVDGELDGSPSLDAKGDDVGADDEDGVSLGGPILGGIENLIQVVASDEGFLDAWVDLNDDGDWNDDNEQLFAAEPLGAGRNTLRAAPRPVPVVAAQYFRFRFSSTGGLSPDGPAPDGEVEDYYIGGDSDWGDIRRLYPTIRSDNGARHFIEDGFHLGATVDAEPDGQLSAFADADDLSGPVDDEDGVVLIGGVLPQPGNIAPFVVTASAAGILNVFADWNQDGDFADFGETEPPRALVAGPNAVNIAVAPHIGKAVFFRFRFSRAGGLTATGPAPEGEVEDYLFRETDDPKHPRRGMLTPLGPGAGGGLTDGFVIEVVGRVVAIYQPSTGDSFVGALNSDGTFSASQGPLVGIPGGDVNTGGGIHGNADHDWKIWGQTVVPPLPLHPGGPLDPGVLLANSEGGILVGGGGGVAHELHADPVTLDFGDAPAAYGAASHSIRQDAIILSGDLAGFQLFALGATVDAEAANQPSANADADDLGAAPDDEDGVEFLDPVLPGERTRIRITDTVGPVGPSRAFIRGWLDSDQSGTFDADELLVDLVALAPPPAPGGSPAVAAQSSARVSQEGSLDPGLPDDFFPPPGDIMRLDHGSWSILIPNEGDPALGYYWRFRISEIRDLGATGFGGDGEVEDYFVVERLSHSVIAEGVFSRGRYFGSCAVPPVSGFTDTYIVTVEGNAITIEQPSTGDINTGVVNPDGTFSATSAKGESYEGTSTPDWSLWGANRYPAGSGCTYEWDFHMTPG